MYNLLAAERGGRRKTWRIYFIETLNIWGMSMENRNIRDYLQAGQRAHLVGVGGVSMASLAEVLHAGGVKVTGSDQRESATVLHLRGLGIEVVIGHLPESVEGADCVIRTAAVHDGNPEIAAARAAGIPVFERAQAWGAIMRDYSNALCISGTHGKTTTTSMCTHIFMAAQKDPTVMIGGTLPLLEACHRVGRGDTIILESCEYCDSFLSFSPTVAVILNVEADHLDYFEDLAAVEKSFRAFADKVPENGLIVANCEDENTMFTLRGEERPMLTFGVEKGDVHAAGLAMERGFGSFDVMYKGEKYAHLDLSVPGMHNVKNAIAAAAAAIALNLPGKAVEDGMRDFRLPGRRFEYKGTYNGARLYDDYAHHPGELASLFDTAEALGHKRVICAFQPHTYSRTCELFDGFVEVLKRPDVTILAEIFAAREDNETGISSADLAAKIPGSVYCPTLAGVTEKLRELARPGDLLLTVGAGDIYLAGESLVKDA